MADLELPVASRQRTYGGLVAVVGCLLAAGLAVPMAFGERVAEQGLAAGPDLDLSGLDAGDGDSAGGMGGEGGATPTGGPGDGEGDAGASAAGGTGAMAPGSGGAGGAAGGEASPAGAGAAPSDAPRTASDVGVTPDAIKIGLLVPTSASIGSTSDQQAIQEAEFQVFFDEINARGGIHGRRIETAVATYDLLDQNEGARAGCLKLADDDKVFAVFNTTGYGPPGSLCLTREKGVPFLQASGHPEEIYGQANGLYSSTFDNQTRNFRNMVGTLHALRALEGRKVGVLGTEWLGLRREQEEGIVDTLKALGYDPFVYWLSGDPVSSQAQIPIAVQQMRSNGVTAVMLGADFLSGQSFVQQSDSQGYRPFYAAADPWGYSTDYIVESMPASFEGSMTVTAMRTYDHRVGVPEPAIDAACAKTFEDGTGIDLDRTNDPDALYVGTLFACGIVQRFERAATAAGPELTRAGLVRAIGAQGTVELPFAGGLGTYRPDKLDGADHYRAQRWQADCRCWQPIVPAFSKGRY